MRGWCKRGRVELHELDVGHGHPGPQAPWRCRRRWPRAGWWSRRRAGPAPPVASSTCGRANLGRAPDWSSAVTPTHRPPSSIRSRANVFSCSAAAVRWHGGDQRPLDLDAGGRTAGVHDARQAVPALASQLQARPCSSTVEHGAQRDQLVDPARTFVDQHPDRVGVAQPGARGQRVGQVQVGRVGVLVQHRGHAALRPAGRGLVELALGEHTRHACRGGRPRRAPPPTGRPRRCPAPAGRGAQRPPASRSSGRRRLHR